MLKLRAVLLNSKAAIDLASIMVGIIVIGLIGGVIAATVFAVIPWAQDSAAKQQLESIHTAQNAAFGLSADPSRALPVGQERNSFTNSQGLQAAGLLTLSDSGVYCTVNFVNPDGSSNYIGWVQSASGKIFYATNDNKTVKDDTSLKVLPCVKPAQNNESGIPVGGYDPEIVAPGHTGSETEPTIPGDNTENPADPGEEASNSSQDYVTSYTLNCPTKTTFQLHLMGATGTLKWSDRDSADALNNQMPKTRTLEANVEYKVVFTGTFKGFYSVSSSPATGMAPQLPCYRSMDSWGSKSGTTSASGAFGYMSNLKSLPSAIPSTVTNMSNMFYNSRFNQDISSWDTSNVKYMTGTFHYATKFNQNISNWNVDNVVSYTNFRTNSGLTAENSPF